MSDLSVKEDAAVDPNTLVMFINQIEWLKISEEGFWVRGEKVAQGQDEARIVYQAFQDFLMWANLTREY